MTTQRFRQKIGSKSGQSILEFLLAMSLLMFVMFGYLRIALFFGYGHLAHYATFMSARAYFAGGASQGDQADRAKQVLVSLLKKSSSDPQDKFPAIAKGDGGSAGIVGMDINGAQYAPGDNDSSWMQGVRYTFKGTLFMLPLGGRNKKTNEIKLTSESWLGREPTTSECTSYMLGKGIWDNGC